MGIVENKAPNGIAVFNYARTKNILPPADEIDTLTPDEIMAELTRDDPNPYYSVEAIRFPASGNGLQIGTTGIYKKSFFQSFINKTKTGVIPGSKHGHDWSSRSPNDFYMIGGKIEEDDDNKDSGTAYFKMYIPPKGYETDNYGFIRDAKIRNVEYSLVTRPKYQVKKNDLGIDEYHITESLGDERNDAVNKGAMVQAVNADDVEDAVGPVDAYRNFHSARVREPGDFRENGAWANKTIDESNGIQLVMGQLKNPPKGQSGSMVAQAYRFPITKFSPAEAKAWCNAHDISFIKFTVGKDYKAGNSIENEDQSIDSSVANARRLIGAGKYDNVGKWSFTADDGNKLLGDNGNDWTNYKKWHLAEDTSAPEDTKARYKYPYGKNGIVYRSALRAIAARASAEGLQDLSSTASDLIKLIDTKKSSRNGGISVERQDAIDLFANRIANGQEKIVELATDLGIADKLRNADDEKNAELVKVLNEKLGEKPLEKLESILAENKANAEATVKNTVAALVGPEKIKDATGKDMDNPSYQYALSKLSGLSGEALKNGIESLKNDPVMNALNAKKADSFSNVNMVVNGKDKVTGGIPVQNT